MVVIAHSPPPSARARALTERLRAAIADFRMREPKLTDDEVITALTAARPMTSGARGPGFAPWLATAIGMVAALALGLLVSGAMKSERPLPVWPIVAVVTLALAVIMGIVLRTRNG